MKLYTASEIASLLNVSVKTIRRYAKKRTDWLGSAGRQRRKNDVLLKKRR